MAPSSALANEACVGVVCVGGGVVRSGAATGGEWESSVGAGGDGGQSNWARHFEQNVRVTQRVQRPL